MNTPRSTYTIGRNAMAMQGNICMSMYICGVQGSKTNGLLHELDMRDYASIYLPSNSEIKHSSSALGTGQGSEIYTGLGPN